VKVRWDQKYLYIESNGLPAHGMMTGITSWQQQVPLPQAYSGDNAWRLPLTPVPATQPRPVKNAFLRGAIAIAANGIPIFNPQNNRGELSAMIGELDQWGGHCGRGDDYHYHAAPLHLQATLGPTKPIGYALDGYPIYGLTEPDGSAPGGLDPFNGHTTPQLGYHYHASRTYPYVNGGFHGEVVEREGQVDPQPRARSVRPALPPLGGAKITGFTASPDQKSFRLQYTIGGKPAAVNYATASDGAWKFQFISTDGSTREETYRGGDPGNRPPGPDRALPPADKPAAPEPAAISKPLAGFQLTSAEIKADGLLPIDYTGDGAGATLPLAWSGAPAGTKSYALIMHHIDPEGVAKWYWTLYDIPASVTTLPKNTRDIGKTGTGFKGNVGYEPPHSKGPGPKTYTLTLYALSGPAKVTVPPAAVNRAVLLAAIRDSVLATAELKVTYSSKETDRPSADRPPGDGPRPPRGDGPPRDR